MPTETFENLPEERKNKFIDAAFEEFIQNDYEGASISRMVKKLGFGKGSVYRYFEDKRDLYFYLKELAEKRKMEMVMPVMRDHSRDFFEMYKALYRVGLEFMRAEPRYSQFLYNLSKEMGKKEFGEMIQQHKKMAVDAFEKEILQYQQEKIIRDDLPASMIAFFVVEASNVVSAYILLNYKESFEKAILEPEHKFELPDKEIEEVSAAVVLMMKEGIAFQD